MASTGWLTNWASSVVSDSARRRERFRKASIVEGVCATLAAICAFGAIWSFTSDISVLEGIRPDAVGGVAVLCFSAMMFIAAGAGIEKRFIALISELDKQS